MNIRQFECPNCGGTLLARDTDTKVYCKTCDYEFLLGGNGDEEDDAAYANHLASEIDELFDTLCQYGKVNAEIEALQKQKSSLSHKGGLSESFGRLITYLLASAVAVFLMVVLNIIGAPMILFFLFGLAAAAAYLVMGTIMIQFAQNAQLDVNDLTQAIDERENRLIQMDKVIHAHRNLRIPVEYRNKQALNYIQDMLTSREAYSVEDAIYLYDDELRRNPALASQQNQAAEQMTQFTQRGLQNQGKIDIQSRIRNAIEYMGGIKIFLFVTGLVLLSFIVTGAIVAI